MNKITKPWGFEVVWANTNLYSGRMLVIKNGERTSYIYNKHRYKTLLILQGIVVVTLDGTNRTLEEGQIVQIEPKTMNRLAAIQGDATILEAGTELEEEVVVEDDYKTTR
jgi:quercetin dioxygenase-like cupin family protein